MIFAWSDAVKIMRRFWQQVSNNVVFKIMRRFYKSWGDFDSNCQTTMLSKSWGGLTNHAI